MTPRLALHDVPRAGQITATAKAERHNNTLAARLDAAHKRARLAELYERGLSNMQLEADMLRWLRAI